MDEDEFLKGLQTVFATMSPLMRELGYRITQVEPGMVEAMLPFSEDLVGDPVSRVIHGGAVTTLLDTTGGAAVLAALREPVAIATLDLRIDYLHGSAEGLDMHARVECYRLTKDVAFARGFAYDRDADDPVASMAATYMVKTPLVRAEASQ